METAAATRCVLYLRISLDSTGERLAVARQREDCQRIATERGWAIAGEYVDNSIGAYSKTGVRPRYNELVSAYRDGQFNALVCWDLDRLTRQPRQLEDWIDAAEDKGLLLVTANGEADLTTDGGRLFARIKASVARAESERKAARQKRALRQRAEAGRPPLGVRLTGYTTAGEVIEEEAEFVRAVFRRFYEGDSLRGICTWLTELGAVARHGGAWSPSSIRTTLTNPRYAGRAVYQGAPTGELGNWEPLVEEWMFEAVAVILSDPRRRSQVGTDRKHLGSGLYLCGICDTPLRAHTSVPAGGGRSRLRYRCPRGGHVTRSAGPVDELIATLVCMHLANPDASAQGVFEPETEAARQAAETVKRLRISLRKAELDYDSDLIDGARYKAKRDKITAELDEAEASQSLSPGGAGIARRLAGFGPDLAAVRAGFDALPIGGKRTVISRLIIVRLDRAPRGKHFDPSSVLIEWRRSK